MAAADYLYGFEIAEDVAESLDQTGDDTPGALHRVTIPRGDGLVLWGHGIIDSGKDESEGSWEPVDMAKAPHIHSSIVEYFQHLVPGHAAILYVRK